MVHWRTERGRAVKQERGGNGFSSEYDRTAVKGEFGEVEEEEEREEEDDSVV